MRILGRSGIEVSEIGAGCWAIGGPFTGGGRPNGWGEVDDEESVAALRRALKAERTSVVVMRTDPSVGTAAGGHWWDVGVPEVSDRPRVLDARSVYEAQRVAQRLGD